MVIVDLFICVVCVYLRLLTCQYSPAHVWPMWPWRNDLCIDRTRSLFVQWPASPYWPSQQWPMVDGSALARCCTLPLVGWLRFADLGRTDAAWRLLRTWCCCILHFCLLVGTWWVQIWFLIASTRFESCCGAGTPFCRFCSVAGTSSTTYVICGTSCTLLPAGLLRTLLYLLLYLLYVVIVLRCTCHWPRISWTFCMYMVCQRTWLFEYAAAPYSPRCAEPARLLPARCIYSCQPAPVRYCALPQLKKPCLALKTSPNPDFCLYLPSLGSTTIPTLPIVAFTVGCVAQLRGCVYTFAHVAVGSCTDLPRAFYILLVGLLFTLVTLGCWLFDWLLLVNYIILPRCWIGWRTVAFYAVGPLVGWFFLLPAHCCCILHLHWLSLYLPVGYGVYVGYFGCCYVILLLPRFHYCWFCYTFWHFYLVLLL